MYITVVFHYLSFFCLINKLVHAFGTNEPCRMLIKLPTNTLINTNSSLSVQYFWVLCFLVLHLAVICYFQGDKPRRHASEVMGSDFKELEGRELNFLTDGPSRPINRKHCASAHKIITEFGSERKNSFLQWKLMIHCFISPEKTSLQQQSCKITPQDTKLRYDLAPGRDDVIIASCLF